MRTSPTTFAAAADVALRLPRNVYDAVETERPGTVVAALGAAAAKARAALSNAFTLPLLAWDEDIVDAVANIAVWMVLRQSGAYRPTDLAQDPYKSAHDEALRWLDQVAAKKLAPTVTESDPVVEGAEVISPPQRGWNPADNGTSTFEVWISEDRGW